MTGVPAESVDIREGVTVSISTSSVESVDIREGVTVSISTSSIISGDTDGGKSNNGLEHRHVCVIISH